MFGKNSLAVLNILGICGKKGNGDIERSGPSILALPSHDGITSDEHDGLNEDK